MKISNYRTLVLVAGIAAIISVLTLSFVYSQAVSSTNVSYLNQWTGTGFYSYLIFTDGTNTYAKNGNTGQIDYTAQQSSTVLQNVFNNLPNGGLVIMRAGFYNMLSNVTTSNNGIELVGEGYSTTQSASVTSTRLWLSGNVGISMTGKWDRIDNVFINAATTTATTPALLMGGSQCRVGSITVWGSNSANAIQFGQGTGDISGGYITNCKVDHLYIQNGGGASNKAALYLYKATQSEFTSVVTNAATTNAVILDSSDNNHFARLQITAMQGASTTGIIIGTNATSPSYGESFDYLDTAGTSTFTPIVINYNAVSNFNSISTIRSWTDEDTNRASVTFNNNSYGSLLVYSPNVVDSRGWWIATPALPGGTGTGYAVQNTFPFKVQIFMTGANGVHIIDIDGRDFGLGLAPNTVILNVGDKIYFTTTIPSSWKWIEN